MYRGGFTKTQVSCTIIPRLVTNIHGSPKYLFYTGKNPHHVTPSEF